MRYRWRSGAAVGNTFLPIFPGVHLSDFDKQAGEEIHPISVRTRYLEQIRNNEWSRMRCTIKHCRSMATIRSSGCESRKNTQFWTLIFVSLQFDPQRADATL